MIAMGSTARPDVNSFQVGAFQDSGAVDTSYLDTANSPRMQSLNIVYNYASFANQMAGFETSLKKAGLNNPFVGSDLQYITIKPNKA